MHTVAENTARHHAPTMAGRRHDDALSLEELGLSLTVHELNLALMINELRERQAEREREKVRCEAWLSDLEKLRQRLLAEISSLGGA